MLRIITFQSASIICALLLSGFQVESAKTKAPSEDSDKSGSDIVASHNTRFSSPTASSYYGYQMSPNSFRHNYMYSPLLTDPYERVGREYASASSNIGYAASAPDLVTAAGGHGGGGGGHGGGHGWHGGHGHGHGGYTKVNNNGLGLLGLLGLLSLLQGVLNALARSTTTTTTTMAPAGRKSALYDYDTYEYKSKQKRSIRDTGRTEEESLPDRITRMVLPSLNVVAHARDGNIPLNCTHHEVCRVSNIFMRELGSDGHLVGYRISEAIGVLLMEMDDTGSIRHSLDSASTAGLHGLDCHVQYPMCTEMLKSNGASAYPPIMLGMPYTKESIMKLKQ